MNPLLIKVAPYLIKGGVLLLQVLIQKALAKKKP